MGIIEIIPEKKIQSIEDNTKKYLKPLFDRLPDPIIIDGGARIDMCGC